MTENYNYLNQIVKVYMFNLLCSWNYERMQTWVKHTYWIPAIKNSTQRKKTKRLPERHMEFFNTHPYVCSNHRGNSCPWRRKEQTVLRITDIQGVKIGMMGPLAGIEIQSSYSTSYSGALLAASGNILVHLSSLSHGMHHGLCGTPKNLDTE